MGAAVAERGLTKTKSVAFWVLKIALALLFLAAAGFKLSGQPAAVAEFDLVGFGQGFRYFTGGSEVAGALLLLWPRTTAYGALLLAAISIGAFVAQLGVLHGDVIHAIVLAGVFAAIAWAHRGQLVNATTEPPTRA